MWVALFADPFLSADAGKALSSIVSTFTNYKRCTQPGSDWIEGVQELTWIISLPLGYDNFADSLGNYFDDEIPDLHCICGSKLRITSPGQFLVVHLRRYESLSQGRVKKITKDIIPPDTLHLGAYDLTSGVRTMRLRAVIISVGSTPKSGHYTCFAWRRTDMTAFV